MVELTWVHRVRCIQLSLWLLLTHGTHSAGGSLHVEKVWLKLTEKENLASLCFFTLLALNHQRVLEF